MALRIAITAGEPAGIGPELLVRIAQCAFDVRLIAVADGHCLLAAAATLGLPLALVDDDPTQLHPLPPGTLALSPVHLAHSAVPGLLDPRNRPATLQMLAWAADASMRGEVDAIVTAPVNKSNLDDPIEPFLGHTEFFAARAGVGQVLMMLIAAPSGQPPLRVALATTHLPLRAVSAAIRADTLTTTLTLLNAGLRQDYAIAAPRILVLGLNPHAGEAGHLGDEEIRVIGPVIEDLRAKGMHLIGPLPADTAFTQKYLRDADAVLAMFHDQGLPVLKYAGFGRSVNVTLGLPFVRTSVDHGTALDIAGKNLADPGSMIAAIAEAVRIVHARRNA